MGGLYSSREANSAYGLPSAPERRKCKSRVTLLLRDADSGQIDHMAAEPTHGPHHPCSSSTWLGYCTLHYTLLSKYTETRNTLAS